MIGDPEWPIPTPLVIWQRQAYTQSPGPCQGLLGKRYPNLNCRSRRRGGLEYQLLKLEPEASAIAALDINPEQYKVPEIDCQFCDLNGRIPFDDASFDVCFSIEVIEHLNNPQNIINEAHRVLKSGGMLFLSTPNLNSIAQKLRFLFSDEFQWFREKDHRILGHIHPIEPPRLFRRLVSLSQAAMADSSNC
ncbi:MAG: hypothetical protein DRR15_07030 [Gammaproteobacteria bacterium]|nr:MAG: hypothetical protein DRR15_07030 [Gammaproteobacteria bacterium]